MKKLIYFLSSLVIIGLLPTLGSAQVNAVGFGDLQELMTMNSKDRGDKSGSASSGSGGGSGGANANGVFINVPDSTKIVRSSRNIEWRASKQNGPFQVQISGTGRDNAVYYTAIVEGHMAFIPFDQLTLMEGKMYELSVKPAASTFEGQASTAHFTIGSQVEYNNIIENAKSSPKFEKASKLEKVLLKALNLEMNGYKLAAGKYYKTPMKTDKDFMMMIDMWDDYVERTGL